MKKKCKKKDELSSRSADLPSTNYSFVHLACLVFLILIIYVNAYNVPFQWDEENHIVNEPIIKNLYYFIYPSKAQGLEHYNFFISRYVAHLTFALNYWLHGLSVTGYHIGNIAIHIANSLLVYLLVLLTFRTPFMEASSLKKHSRNIAFFSSLLFAAHPIQTAAVTYIMQRFASLVAFFYLLSLTTYIKSRLCSLDERPDRDRYCLFYYGISFLSAVLAMKTKENAFTLPFVIALYEFCFFKGGLKRRLLFLSPMLLPLCIIPFTLLSLPEAAGGGSLFDPGAYMSGFTWDYSRAEYFFTQFRVIVTYLRLLFFPVGLAINYEYPVYRSFFDPQVLASFLFLSLLFTFGVYLIKGKRRRAGYGNSYTEYSIVGNLPDIRLMGFGILWFFITLSVESSLITTPRLIETYRAYLPSAGIVICVVTGAFLLKDRMRLQKIGRPMLVLVTLVLTLLSVATLLENKRYGDSRKMWEDTIRRFPRYAKAHTRLGQFYQETKMLDKAIEQYQIAIKLKPDYAEPHNNLGMIYRALGRPDKAIEQHQIAIKLNPGLAEPHNNLGAIYTDLHMFDQAIEHYQIAIKLNPDIAESYFNLGLVYSLIGNKEMARKELLNFLNIKPDFQPAQQLLKEVAP